MKTKPYPARTGFLLLSTLVKLMTNRPVSAAGFAKIWPSSKSMPVRSCCTIRRIWRKWRLRRRAGPGLTIVQFTQPENVTDGVNSQWRLREHSYAGDIANRYNDGLPTPGAKPLGLYYEMESSSPAAVLAPGESLTHIPRTIHMSGSENDLDVVAGDAGFFACKNSKCFEALTHHK